MTLSIPSRLVAEDSRSDSFQPRADGLPPLAPIDWHAAGLTPPQPLETPAKLPEADVVVIVWADAEWAAAHHVFCASTQSMPYSDANAGKFPDWEKDSADMIDGTAEWTYWGYYRLVQVGNTSVLLYKSNTHLDYPGEAALRALTQRLAAVVQPKLILSTGTAGGANATDHVGTVPIVSSATFYQAGQPSGGWPTYASSWTAPTATLDQPSFGEILMPIPITSAALDQLAQQLNAHEGTSYTLDQLDPLGLNRPDPQPAIRNTSGDPMGLLTASTFLVGTTDNRFDAYACIEMDDAIVAAECEKASVQYGSVRNLSDPAQNPALPSRTQGNWGGAIYRAYGLYTSFNGALAAWAAVAS
jgi:nucleoside phosphorylase